ncbi:pyridoxal kinase [Synchytrium microbalum]|uniref:pyridoxal kinase n=1 Tax=Synchytrium microbalum TaxID=1806994 RepID=A0A507C9S8_9FUNG|nr:pyridoxal kinase [Synchytrium microbalum]TPX34303.1 pyridoxal kinase [Synchytrium microbalum]
MSKRVLSIQSHVVYGYVGNKAATFPLQLLGFDVDAVNTVQFCNHTGYPTVAGERLEGESLRKIADGLAANGMLETYSHLLTGYIGRETALQAVAELAQNLKKRNPELIFVLDPVMGDEGKLYVPEPLINIYKTTLLPLADILTPNAFEAELLTGTKITSTETATQALTWLHTHSSARYIIITSAAFDNDASHLHLIASYKDTDGAYKQLVISFAKLHLSSGSFTGTGDLFSAMMVAHLRPHPEFGDFVRACETAVAILQGILNATIGRFEQVLKSEEALSGNGEMSSVRLIQGRELALISSRGAIEHPDIVYRARLI